MQSQKQRFHNDATVLLSAARQSDQIDQSIIVALWDELQGYYNDSKRHYHNLQHLANLFALFDEYQSKLTEPQIVRWAIWYHDIIYNAKGKDNEAKSAQLGAERLQQLQMPDQQIAQVVKFIEATAQHLSVEATGDLAYFLDFDLAILGTSLTAYKTYAEAVRKEYRHVPGFLYRRGRRKVLEYFLNAEQLFRTSELRDRLDHQARENMRQELTGFS